MSILQLVLCLKVVRCFKSCIKKILIAGQNYSFWSIEVITYLFLSLRITMRTSSRINSTTSAMINQNHQDLTTFVLLVLADLGFSGPVGAMLVTGDIVEGCVSTFKIVEEIPGLLIVFLIVEERE